MTGQTGATLHMNKAKRRVEALLETLNRPIGALDEAADILDKIGDLLVELAEERGHNVDEWRR